MVCKICGAETEEGMEVCAVCDVSVQTDNDEECAGCAFCSECGVGSEKTHIAGRVDEMVSGHASGSKNRKLTVSIIVSAIMVVIIALGMLVATGIFRFGYEEVAVDYSYTYITADYMKMSEYCINDYLDYYERMIEYSCANEYGMTTEDFFAYLSEQYGRDIGDASRMLDIMNEEAEKFLLETYGKYTISAEITDSVKMSPDKLSGIKNTIKQENAGEYPSKYAGVDVEGITDGYIVSISLAVDGIQDSGVEEIDVSVVKYNGAWKVVGE